MKGLLLWLVALVIRPLILLAGVLYGLVRCFYKRHFRGGWQAADAKFFSMAASIDKYGNAICAELFNAALIKSEAAHKFGKIDETISAVLGINETEVALTTTGAIVVALLDLIDKGHCRKAAELNFLKTTIHMTQRSTLLKAEVYDMIGTIEQYQQGIKELQGKIARANEKIVEALAEETAAKQAPAPVLDIDPVPPADPKDVLDIDPVPPADPKDVLDIDPVPPQDPVFP